MKNPAQFVNEVRNEAAKVVWPTRKEAGITTLMVFIMATLVDQILAWGVDLLLNLNV